MVQDQGKMGETFTATFSVSLLSVSGVGGVGGNTREEPTPSLPTVSAPRGGEWPCGVIPKSPRVRFQSF